MLPDRESLTVEFKSEQRRPQSDDEIVDNIVALANTQGGTLYLGIEDNGTVTGVSEQHSNITMDSRPSYSTKPYRSRPSPNRVFSRTWLPSGSNRSR